MLKEGAADSAIGRRGVLQGAMIGALALFPLAIVVPIVGNVGGDWNVSKFRPHDVEEGHPAHHGPVRPADQGRRT